jgi:two-component system chemotaxis response regulator CheY
MMKALIIEDEPMIRLLLKRLLTRFFPHNVLEASDGEEGYALVEKERPAIVFCDMFMPKLDGIGFLQRLRANPEFAELPVIAMSSAKDRELVLKLVELRIADYLVKPIDLEQTFKRLEKLLPTLLADKEAAS